MADQADVYVKNSLTDSIRAIRYCLPGNESDLDISIIDGKEEMIYLVKMQSYLSITPPIGKYTGDCKLTISNEELLSCSTLDDHWTVEIKSNNLPPDTPTTANVEVGDVEPT